MKKLLKKYTIKQTDIALLIKCSQTLVSKWCCGRCEPSLNAIIKISETFSIPIEEIVLAFRNEDKINSTSEVLEDQIKIELL